MGRSNRMRAFSLILAAVMLVCTLTACGTVAEPVQVFDGANTISIFPESGVPVSELTKDDFIADQNGIPVYKGELYTTERGIDVSEFQGDIDWAAVAGGNVQFVFLRCGYRGASEGGLSADQRFRENFDEARAAGLEVGVYFYSQALNKTEALEEAELVQETLDGRVPDLPVIFDWERNDTVEGSRTLSADGEAVTDAAAAFCQAVKLAGYTPGIYMNLNTGYHIWDLSKLSDYVIWLSDPSAYPHFYYQFEYWQYSFTGSVPGIAGECDLNMRFMPRQVSSAPPQ